MPSTAMPSAVHKPCLIRNGEGGPVRSMATTAEALYTMTMLKPTSKMVEMNSTRSDLSFRATSLFRTPQPEIASDGPGVKPNPTSSENNTRRRQPLGTQNLEPPGRATPAGLKTSNSSRFRAPTRDYDVVSGQQSS